MPKKRYGQNFTIPDRKTHLSDKLTRCDLVLYPNLSNIIFDLFVHVSQHYSTLGMKSHVSFKPTQDDLVLLSNLPNIIFGGVCSCLTLRGLRNLHVKISRLFCSWKPPKLAKLLSCKPTLVFYPNILISNPFVVVSYKFEK